MKFAIIANEIAEKFGISENEKKLREVLLECVTHFRQYEGDLAYREKSIALWEKVESTGDSRLKEAVYRIATHDL